MPGRKRQRREPTHDWQEIEQLMIWPEQEVYERLRPVILFGQTAAERAKETGASERTLHYQAKLFEQEGMASLFPKERSPAAETGRSLPEEMRQLIVNLKFEHPGFTPHEIATVCFLHFERRPSDHTVKRVLAEGPEPSISGRRYPPYAQITDGYQRRRAIVDLHAEGWSNTAISAYLQTPRHRVYEVLKRWAKLGHAGLEDTPRVPARKVGIAEINEVGKLVKESPETFVPSVCVLPWSRSASIFHRRHAADCSPSIANSTGCQSLRVPRRVSAKKCHSRPIFGRRSGQSISDILKSTLLGFQNPST